MPIPSPAFRSTATVALTLAIALTGGSLFTLLGIPASWLMGGMVAVAVGGVAGAPVLMPPKVAAGAFVLLGVSMGSGITPDILHQLARWPLSMVLLSVAVLVSMVASAAWLERVHRWDRATAVYAAVPGALGMVLAFAANSNANLRRVALAQSLRLFTLVIAMPWILTWLMGASGPVNGAAAVGAGLRDTVLMLTAASLGGWVLTRLRVGGGWLMGAMLTSAILHGTGTVHHNMPPWLLVAGFTATGAVIGSRFRGVSIGALRADLRPSLESVGLAMVLSAGFSALGAHFLSLAFGQFWLAYAPGGVEAMAVMAFSLGLDAAFVGTHHIVRIIGLTALLPVWARRAA